MALIVRNSAEGDAAAIRDIYAKYVLTGFASFEELPPDAPEIARRRADVLAQGLPHLVAELDGTVVGYAYASTYRARAAYRYTVEDSVYVRDDVVRRGVGRALLAELIARCEVLGMRQMVAVIGDSANQGSIALHAAVGFHPAGLLRSVGYKLGRWVDSVIMQRALGPGDTTQPAQPRRV